MIQPCSIVDIIDNTGGQKGECIKVFNKTKSQTASVGDIILVSIKKAKTRKKIKKVKKKDLYRGIIVHTKKKINRYDGSTLNFFKNSIVLFKYDNKKKKQILGTRILNPVPNDLRHNVDYLKLISLSSKTI